MTENELKKAVLVIAYANGWAVKHEPQIKPRRPVRKKVNGSTGFPDLLFARDRELLFIECKQEHEEQTPEQRFWESILPAYHVIRPSDLETGRLAELLG